MFKKYIDYFRNNPEGYWFKNKIYGWGWVPVTWQGFAVLGVFILLIVLLTLRLDSKESLHDALYDFFLPTLVLVVLLLVICYKTGEKPRWRWGIDDTDTK